MLSYVPDTICVHTKRGSNECLQTSDSVHEPPAKSVFSNAQGEEYTADTRRGRADGGNPNGANQRRGLGRADIDGEAGVTVSDAIMILQFEAGIITEFSIK